MPPPWVGMLLVIAVLAGAFPLLGYAGRRFGVGPEVSRKIVHVGLGLVCAGFPWLFDRAWPVAVLTGASVSLLAAVRFVPRLRAGFGHVLGGVERTSLGDVYYPVGVAILFALAAGDRVLYCVPVLILTLADAGAALVGARFGSVRYTTIEGHKTVEGSAVFFTLAFLGTALPLLLATDAGPVRSVMTGCIVGLLVMLVEAVAWRGLDNILIPLFGYLLLRTYLDLTTAALAGRLAVALLTVLLFLAWRRRTTLNDAAVLGAALFGYACWSLGGWRWLVAPVVVYSMYNLLVPRVRGYVFRIHDITAVIAVAGPGLVWLFLAGQRDRPDYLYPFTITFASQLAIIGFARLARAQAGIGLVRPYLLATAVGWLLPGSMYVLTAGATPGALLRGGVALGAVALAAGAFALIQPGLEDCPGDTPRWLRQAACAMLVSFAGLLI